MISPATDAGSVRPAGGSQRGVHPDVIVIEPGDTGSIKIEQVRDVIDRAGYRPFEGRRRVVIIDEADAMVAPAQNALLKTLEEPPSGVGLRARVVHRRRAAADRALAVLRAFGLRHCRPRR